MKSPERAMIFLDSSNFYYSLKEIGKSLYDIDFHKFSSLILVANRNLVKFFYYTAPVDRATVPEMYKAQQFFWSRLQSQGITLRLGYLQRKLFKCPRCGIEQNGIKCPQCGNIFARLEEKGVDVHIATDIVSYAASNEYDIGYLVSSDGDLAEACKRARSLGKRIVYICVPPIQSMALTKACNYTAKKDHSFFDSCRI